MTEDKKGADVAVIFERSGGPGAAESSHAEDGAASPADTVEENAKREQFAKENDTDTHIFTGFVKLYRYNLAEKSWVERGTGKIKVSLEKKTNKYRVTQIRDKIYKLGCNHFLTERTELAKYKLADHAWTWLTVGDDCGDGLGPVQKFIAKFSNAEDCEGFRKAFAAGKEHNIGKAKEDLLEGAAKEEKSCGEKGGEAKTGGPADPLHPSVSEAKQTDASGAVEKKEPVSESLSGKAD